MAGAGRAAVLHGSAITRAVLPHQPYPSSRCLFHLFISVAIRKTEMSHPLQELPGAISPGLTLGYFPNEHLAEAVSMHSTGSTAAPSWDPHLPPPTRGLHHSQDIFAQSCVCCWTARPAEGTWLQPASLGMWPNFTLATLSPAAAEHSQCLKLVLAITRKLL